MVHQAAAKLLFCGCFTVYAGALSSSLVTFLRTSIPSWHSYCLLSSWTNFDSAARKIPVNSRRGYVLAMLAGFLSQSEDGWLIVLARKFSVRDSRPQTAPLPVALCIFQWFQRAKICRLLTMRQQNRSQTNSSDRLLMFRLQYYRELCSITPDLSPLSPRFRDLMWALCLPFQGAPDVINSLRDAFEEQMNQATVESNFSSPRPRLLLRSSATATTRNCQASL